MFADRLPGGGVPPQLRPVIGVAGRALLEVSLLELSGSERCEPRTFPEGQEEHAGREQDLQAGD